MELKVVVDIDWKYSTIFAFNDIEEVTLLHNRSVVPCHN